MGIEDLGSLNLYMNEINRTPQISREQEQEYFKMFKSGDLDARNKIIQSNLRFVVSVAKEYQHCGLTLTELISEGNIGLFEAVKRFDENRGFKFITYAVWWIRQSILKVISTQSDAVCLPVNRHADLRECEEAELQLGQILGREPTTSDIAERLGYTINRVEHAFETDSPIVYLDKEYGDGDPIPFHTVVGDEHAAVPSLYPEEREIKELIYRILSSVDERAKKILLDYYGFRGKDLTLEQIGGNIGITRERVRQIRDDKLEKIRTSLVGQGLDLSDFL